MTIQKLFTELKGRGRGNWGHAGRPGKRGGSTSRGVISSSVIGNRSLEDVISKGSTEDIAKYIDEKIPYKKMVDDFYKNGTDSQYMNAAKGLHRNPSEFREIANSRSKKNIEEDLKVNLNNPTVSKDLKRSGKDSRFWYSINELMNL